LLISNSSKESGGILITALVVVVMVTIIAATIQRDYFRSISLVESSLSRSGAYLVMDSTPDLVAVLLQSDTNHTVDSLNDGWLQPISPMAVSGGMLSAQIIDANSRFNLNSLAEGGGADEEYSVSQRRFIRLLQTFEDLPLSQFQAEQLTKALKDYIDADDFVVDFESAETEYYATRSPLAYRASNQPLESVSELRLVRYFTPDIISRLMPLVTVLPTTESGFNVNTAPEALLRTLNTTNDLFPLDPAMVHEWQELRMTTPFIGQQDFAATSSVQQLQNGDEVIALDDLLYASRYIDLAVDLRWRERLYIYSALLERDEQRVTLVKKTNGIL